MKVSIIIVSYNAKHHLQICLESCIKAIQNIDAEIIVVDNNSTDNVVDYLSPIFPTVRFVGLQQNLGFSKANNYGVNIAQGEYILILNPDTIIPEDLFDSMIKFYQNNNKIGIVGVRLVDANGNFHPESKRNLPNPINSFAKLFNIGNLGNNTYYKTSVNEDQTAPTSILVGAFMFLKKSIYQEIGGFDSRYFMYGEDIDISYSCELAGYKNYYKGDLIVLHYKGESTKKDAKYFKIFFQAMNLFVDKYYKDKLVQKIFMKSGIAAKYYISLLSYKLSNNISDDAITLQKNELYWLKKSSELQNLKENQIVLCTSIYTFKEILQIIAQNNSSKRTFYIHSHLSGKIIGDKIIIL